ncbi:MAG: hypothetical protein H7296_06660 [Bacteroidia bacterium]|nr:hypothetical protein [Bacteroidia bacterium]
MKLKYLITVFVLITFLCCKKNIIRRMPYQDFTPDYILLNIKRPTREIFFVDSIIYLAQKKITIINPGNYLVLNTVNDTSTYYIFTSYKTDTLSVYSKRYIAYDGSDVDVIPLSFTSTFLSLTVDSINSSLYNAVQK